MLRRQTPAQRALEEPLVLAGADLDMVREREHALHEFVVHERHPDLQRVGHRDSIAQRQHVVREEGLVVEIERRAEAGAPPVPLVQLLEPQPGGRPARAPPRPASRPRDRKSTRLNSSHGYISYAVFCLKKKKKNERIATVHLLSQVEPTCDKTIEVEQIHHRPSSRLTTTRHLKSRISDRRITTQRQHRV